MAGVSRFSLLEWGHRLGWSLRQWIRKILRFTLGYLGYGGIVMAIAAAVMFAAVLGWDYQEKRLVRVQQQYQQYMRDGKKAPAPVVEKEDGRTRLKAFEDYLLPHEEIPTVVQDVLARAEAEGLRLMRGDYKAEREPQGLFMRYRMALPVKGNADAIHRFMLVALKENRTLVLENVQFKRTRIDSDEIEARIQWILLTQLPEMQPGVVAAGDDR